MNTPEEQQRIEHNMRHAFLRYGWMILLLAAWPLARHFGVI